MAIENEIHPIQVNILLKLLFNPTARFSQLNVLTAPTDQFSFHLKKLLEIGLIEKDGRNYQLSVKGKEFANRFDTDRLVPERQAKVAVGVVGIRMRIDSTEYLIQQRLKQPYYGFFGLVTGKVRWGETTEETAKREFKEETGLSADFKLVGIEHKLDYSMEKEL